MQGTARGVTGKIRRGRTRHFCKVGIYNNTGRGKNRKGITKSNPRQTREESSSYICTRLTENRINLKICIALKLSTDKGFKVEVKLKNLIDQRDTG